MAENRANDSQEGKAMKEKEPENYMKFNAPFFAANYTILK